MARTLLAIYPNDSRCFDEMLTAAGAVRPHWQHFFRHLDAVAPEEMRQRVQFVDRSIQENGVTYNVYADPNGADRPWALDPLPLIIAADEWQQVSSAVAQRAQVLNGMLADLYGEQRLLAEGLLPPALVYGQHGYLWPCHGIRPPGDAWLHFYAADCFPGEQPILAGALALMRTIHAEFDFDPEATTVATPVIEVLEKKGVCQDFAHLMLACLRSLGLAARYVSGYLLTHPPPGKPRLVGADASHAWVSVYCPGVEDGWVDLDPTNNLLPDTEHITLAIGRDFGDISPLRGIILGGGSDEPEVAVTVTPLDAAALPGASDHAGGGE